MSRLKMLLLAVFVLALAPTVLAQTDCPAIVKAALDAVDAACSATGRNQVCYGNIHLQATPQDGKTLTFEKTGDIANVADIHNLELSSMSLDDQSWGVALMKLQASLPDTLPGQNVTVLLFGNVEIDNTVDVPVNLLMHAQRGVNVRLRPNTQASVLTSLKADQAVIANGRLKDNSWIRIKLDTGTGWVSADFLTTPSDINKLSIIDPAATAYGPMQSFYFTSGVGDRPCAEAPDSGILIQTPKGAGRITFQINDAKITIGSTVYLQAQPNDFMYVTVVEGQATVTNQNTSMLVPAGSYSVLHLDANGRGTGKPSIPRAYLFKSLLTLPLGIKAFDPVTIAKPLTNEQIKAKLDAANAAANAQANGGGTAQNNGLPPSGDWQVTDTITVNQNCGPDPASWGLVGTTSTGTNTLTFSEDRQTLIFDIHWQPPYTLNRIADNVYKGGSGAITYTITFTSATTFTINNTGLFGQCVLIHEGSGVYAGKK